MDPRPPENGDGGARPRREKVEFPLNVPVELALAFDDGKDVAGTWGDQVMYALAGDRIMFVPPIVRTKLEALGVKRHEPVRITRAQKRDGRRRGVEWRVERAGALERELEASLDQARNGKAGEPASPTPVKATGEAAHQGPALAGNGQSTTNGDGRPHGAAIPQRIHYGEAMKRCLIASLDAARQAEEHAAAGANPVRFTSQDIQGLASTIFIQAAKEGWIDFRNGGAR
jgi:hypothetical protein